MKKHLKAVLSGVVAMALCAVMAGCGESKKDIEDFTEDDFESALSELDKAYSGSNNSSNKSEDSDEVEAIDPFENLTVTFGEIAPYGSVTISGGSSDVKYTADKASDVKNGDVVTVTAEAKRSDTALTETKKEFTVEGLPYYASSLDDIPKETKEKLDKQARDTITATCASMQWGTLKDMELLGYYFLTVKNGFATGMNNKIYCVYKVTESITGVNRASGDKNTVVTGEESYYIYCSFIDLIMLDDKTCSVDLSTCDITSTTTKSDYGTSSGTYWYYGYADLDTMFNYCVTKKIGNYNYESTVKE